MIKSPNLLQIIQIRFDYKKSFWHFFWLFQYLIFLLFVRYCCSVDIFYKACWYPDGYGVAKQFIKSLPTVNNETAASLKVLLVASIIIKHVNRNGNAVQARSIERLPNTMLVRILSVDGMPNTPLNVDFNFHHRTMNLMKLRWQKKKLLKLWKYEENLHDWLYFGKHSSSSKSMYKKNRLVERDVGFWIILICIFLLFRFI